MINRVKKRAAIPEPAQGVALTPTAALKGAGMKAAIAAPTVGGMSTMAMGVITAMITASKMPNLASAMTLRAAFTLAVN
eukprot:CAMPEP_0197716188 /NCGR_PEP_ID=MMETSP1434-20131217/1165_1 /TAXON_ID=265543 /ORGANISM="Minutocellus polymorphus, Strain CCMP3303" /LENGTH=78 /DNA_ID=CAMNT_0043300509 /DNA_START=253 /DNA_END=489 /DNA_ORIENTATION=+